MGFHLLIGVIVVGLIHGLEPGHGWPIAITYSISKAKPYLYGLISSGLLSLFHFISTVLVVVAYLIFDMFVDIPELYLNVVAVILLLGLGIYVILEEEDDEHHVVDAIDLKKIAYIAFVVGFAHEEEFMIIGLILSGVDPWLLVASYSGSVAVSIMGITVLGVKMYDIVRAKVERIDEYLKWIAGLSLIIMGLIILFGDVIPIF